MQQNSHQCAWEYIRTWLIVLLCTLGMPLLTQIKVHRTSRPASPKLLGCAKNEGKMQKKRKYVGEFAALRLLCSNLQADKPQVCLKIWREGTQSSELSNVSIPWCPLELRSFRWALWWFARPRLYTRNYHNHVNEEQLQTNWQMNEFSLPSTAPLWASTCLPNNAARNIWTHKRTHTHMHNSPKRLRTRWETRRRKYGPWRRHWLTSSYIWRRFQPHFSFFCLCLLTGSQRREWALGRGILRDEYTATCSKAISMVMANSSPYQKLLKSREQNQSLPVPFSSKDLQATRKVRGIEKHSLKLPLVISFERFHVLLVRSILRILSCTTFLLVTFGRSEYSPPKRRDFTVRFSGFSAEFGMMDRHLCHCELSLPFEFCFHFCARTCCSVMAPASVWVHCDTIDRPARTTGGGGGDFLSFAGSPALILRLLLPPLNAAGRRENAITTRNPLGFVSCCPCLALAISCKIYTMQDGGGGGGGQSFCSQFWVSRNSFFRRAISDDVKFPISVKAKYAIKCTIAMLMYSFLPQSCSVQVQCFPAKPPLRPTNEITRKTMCFFFWGGGGRGRPSCWNVEMD